MRPYRLSKLLGSFFVMSTLVGCGTSTFSGEFEVRSESKAIRIHPPWSGFGNAQPASGYCAPGASATTVFPRLDHIPESTTVYWTVEGTKSRLTQTLDLQDVIPRGQKGTTVFTLRDDGKWTVHFEKGNSVL